MFSVSSAEKSHTEPIIMHLSMLSRRGGGGAEGGDLIDGMLLSVGLLTNASVPGVELFENLITAFFLILYMSTQNMI